MVRIPEHALLGLVDDGSGLAPLDRGVRLLAAVEEIPARDAVDWPLNTRDRALIAGRREMFGPRLPFVLRCPACDEAVEGELDCDELLATADDPAPGLSAPTSRDVAAAVRAGDARLLAARCAPDGAGTDEDIESRLARAFPLLDVRIEVECPECRGAVAERFDILAYWWAELERLGDRVLDEVHVLARAYGWTEADVLALTPARRRAYLARVGA